MKTMIEKKTKYFKNKYYDRGRPNVGRYGYSPLVLIHLGGGLDTPVYSEKNNMYYDMGMLLMKGRIVHQSYDRLEET